MIDLEPMWAALAKYQPYADQDGHGDSWRKVCEKRTPDLALANFEYIWTFENDVSGAVYNAYLAAATDAAEKASIKAGFKPSKKLELEAAEYVEDAIEDIERAIKERNHE
jgi:hypothetical protein